MMNLPAKLHLSAQELELLNNKEWILTRHTITRKVYDMFGSVNEELKAEAEPYKYLFPENIQCENGKISKGENYQLLPYVILDYPSFFHKDRIFAIRTMFWWGNFFSVTLHLSGVHKQTFTNDPVTVFPFLQKHAFSICVNEDEWQHHFRNDNYKSASDISLSQFTKIAGKQFLKISKNIPVAEWDHAPQFIINTFREIMQFLAISYPGGKKDLLPGSPTAGSDL